MSNSKKGNRYSEDFKKQLYELNLNGKSIPTLASEDYKKMDQQKHTNRNHFQVIILF